MFKEKPDNQITSTDAINQFRDIGGVRGLLAAYQDGVRDFTHANLENADLSQANLSGINLEQANLRGANLSGTNLSEANLTGADLQAANLTQTNLRYANLNGSDLRQAVLKQVDLHRANLSYVNLSHQDLSGANLATVDFQGADLNQANLSGANLTEAKLDAANLKAAVLTGANLSFAYMAYAQLVQADLQQTDLVRANLIGANLEQCVLDRVNLAEARVRKANLKQASLRQANLCNSQLQAANFVGANLQKANLAGAKLEGANLTQTDLRGAEIAYAQQANLELAVVGDLEDGIKHSLHLEFEGRRGSSFAFAPDGEMLAYTTWGERIILVNPQTGEQNMQIDIQSEPVVSVVFSADGRTLHNSFYVNELKLWNPLTGKLIHHLKNHSANITALVFNSNAEVIGMTGTGEPFEMFDVGHETRTFKGYSNGIMTLANSPDGRFTARSGQNLEYQIELLDGQTGQTIRNLTGHKAAVQSLAFSPDSQTLASKSAEDFKLWQVKTGKEIYGCLQSSRRWYPTVAFTQADSRSNPVLISSDFYTEFGHRNATQGINEEINWNASKGGGGSSSTAQVAISADGKVLARHYKNQLVQLWNLQTGEELSALKLNDYNHPLSLSPIGNLLAVGYRQEFALWDVQTKTMIHTFTGHSEYINEIVFSPDGQTIATGSNDSTIKLWNLQTGCEIKTLRAYSSINALAFNSLEQIFASGARDGTIRLWDLKTMAEIHSFKGHKEEVSALAFSPNGKCLASSDRSIIRLWKLSLSLQ